MEVDGLHEGMECNTDTPVGEEHNTTKGNDAWYKLHYVLKAMNRIA